MIKPEVPLSAENRQHVYTKQTGAAASVCLSVTKIGLRYGLIDQDKL